ncbi:type II secretion system protein [Crassaminicella thermophila]|uniref:Type II secretion system protein n=1 Tax=Crassaminicella thermophila TaxID=2599308 RepID=A0A5C0SFS2_CRATE|nr:type II secretion system protein [Crassaminicella thermophila]QEK12128.1 type II secretion system protein [Crassaminicella thermophila]
MKFIRNKKGVTLVEIIVSIAILGIILTSITTLFSSTFTGVFSAGKKSKAIHKAQMEMEQYIATSIQTSNIKVKNISTSNYKIVFSGNPPIKISMRGKEIQYHNENNDVSLTLFVPDN